MILRCWQLIHVPCATHVGHFRLPGAPTHLFPRQPALVPGRGSPPVRPEGLLAEAVARVLCRSLTVAVVSTSCEGHVCILAPPRVGATLTSLSDVNRVGRRGHL